MTTHKAGSRSYGSGTRDPDALKSKTDRPRAGQAEMRQREEVGGSLKHWYSASNAFRLGARLAEFFCPKTWWPK